MSCSSLRRSDMARVNEGSHSFTATHSFHPFVYDPHVVSPVQSIERFTVGVISVFVLLSCCGRFCCVKASARENCCVYRACAVPELRTLRTQDTSDPGHFGTSLEGPNCPDRSALVPKCRKDSSDLSAELPRPKCRSVLARF